MTEQKKLPQSINIVSLRGTLTEKNLEVKTITPKDTSKPPYEALTGNFSVKTGENEVYKFEVFTKKFQNNGQVMTSFNSLISLLDRVSVADLATGNAPEGAVADYISVKAHFDVSEFQGRQGELVSNVRLKADYVNSEAKDKDVEKKFRVTGAIDKIRNAPKREGQEDTEKAIFDLWIVNYMGNISKISLCIPNKTAEEVSEIASVGDSVYFHGELSNFTDVSTVEVPSMFGEPEIRTNNISYTEYQIRGGDNYTLFEDGHKDKVKYSLDHGLLEEAKTARNRFLAGNNNKPKPQQTQPTPSTPVEKLDEDTVSDLNSFLDNL